MPDDKAARLRSAATDLFGDHAGAGVARLAGTGTRTGRRWVTGANEVPDGVVEEVESALRSYRASSVNADIQGVVDAALGAGLHPEVVAARLRVAADGISAPGEGKD